jgi:flagellar basal-body rod protein FlgG
MPRALWTGASGMAAQQINVDVISNNIANVNTVGFKSQRADFQDLFYDTTTAPGVQAGDIGRNPTGSQIGNGVRLSGTPRLFTPGNIQQTGQSTNMAISGDGFFEVTLPNGQTAYTRAGNFTADANGHLVTPDGYLLTPNITIPTNASQVQVAPTGEITATLPGATTSSIVGTVQLSRFINPAGLLDQGQNLYLQGDASGPPQSGTPGTNGLGQIEGGALEQSNVSVVTELVNLIVAQRAFDMNSKSIQTTNQMLETANQLIQ